MNTPYGNQAASTRFYSFISGRKRSGPLAFLAQFFVAWLFLAASVHGQAPGVLIEPDKDLDERGTLVRVVENAIKSGQELRDMAWVANALENPAPRPVIKPALQTRPLTPPELETAGRKAILRLGWYYRCNTCDNWHLTLAGAAYAVSDSGVIAVCWHQLDAARKANYREAYLVVFDHENRLLQVAAVQAADKGMDVALVRVAGEDLKPLALNDQTRPGDAVFLFSAPFGHPGYFSAGQINRFYWTGSAPGNPDTLEGVRSLAINVSTDWAPGSSGAALLDQCGNAIGHVKTISPLKKPSPQHDKAAAPEDVMITLHQAAPARAVRLLLDESHKRAGTAGP